MNQYGGIIIKPKTTLLSLPKDTILVSSILFIVALGLINILQRFLVIENKNMILMSSAMGLFMGVIVTFIATYIICIIINFFGVKITFSKLINIVGFAQVPRLIFALLFTMLCFATPALLKNAPFLQTSNLLMILVSIYSLILIAYGARLEHLENKNEQKT